MEEKKNKKSRIIKGVALLGLFLLVFGVSYALFSITLNGTKKNKITTGNLSLELLNEEGNVIDGDTIGLENAIPMTEEEGKALTPYTFTLKNNGTIDAEYSLSLKDIPLETGENRLDDKYVAISIVEGKNLLEEGTYRLSDIKNRILDAGIIKKGTTKNYKIYTWITEDANEEAMDKLFLTSLEVNGYQVTNDTLSRSILYRDGGISEGILTRYADGNIDVTGKKVNVDVTPSSKTVTKGDRIEFENNMELLTKAGYDVSSINSKSAMNNFIRRTVPEDASKEAEYNRLEAEKETKDKEEIFKKYNLGQEIEDQYEYVEDYIQAITEENPTLARKIGYDYFLLTGYEEFPDAATIHFDDAIEELSINTSGLRFTEVILPSNLKNLDRLYGFSGITELILPDNLESIGKTNILNAISISLDELTIPASVKYVGYRAFATAPIKTINIKGSTDGWHNSWNFGFSGTINQLG